MKVHQVLLLPLVLFVTVSCGHKSDPSEEKKQVTINQDQIDNLLENQTFECASLNGVRCPGGVARVFILDLDVPADSGMCTGFLTASNKLVTNHHCVSTEKECDSTYVSVYNGDSFETARCKSIIKAVDDGRPLSDKAVDFSVIELDRHIRSSDVFKPSSRRASNGEMLTAWVIDHVDLFTGRITELNCYLANRKNSMELTNCAAISGNSGSPVVNERGLVEGVLWGSTTGDNINEGTSLRRRRSLSENAYVTETRHFHAYLK